MSDDGTRPEKCDVGDGGYGKLVPSGEANMNGPLERRRAWSWWYALFLVQFVAVLWPSLYNSSEPSFFGVPFFYWYQLIWVVVAAVLTAIIYFATER